MIEIKEIENISILERLRTEYLAAADYMPGILIEGNRIRAATTGEKHASQRFRTPCRSH